MKNLRCGQLLFKVFGTQNIASFGFFFEDFCRIKMHDGKYLKKLRTLNTS